MAIPWPQILKTAIPHIAAIIAHVIPRFNSKKDLAKITNQNDKTVSEMQDAITSNAQHIKTVAEELQKTVTAVTGMSSSFEEKFVQQEQVLSDLKKEISQSNRLARQALVIGAVACLVALVAVVFMIAKLAW